MGHVQNECFRSQAVTTEFQSPWKPKKFPLSSPWFPPGLEIRENLEKWEGIFQSGKSQGILSRLEKSGNFAQNTGKTGKFE